MAQLTLLDLSIQNIGPYREKQTFGLNVSDRKPIILITSLNGGGKTTFLTAIKLALYGKESFSGTNAAYERFIQSLIRQDSATPATIEVGMEIQSLGKTQQYRLTRQWIPYRNSVKEQFFVLIDGKVSSDLASQWIDSIEEILPASLSELFFLDAEKIEKLSDPDHFSILLKNAFEKFFGLGMLDSIVDHLRMTEKKILQNLEKDSSKQIESESLELKVQELKEVIETNSANLSAAQNELDKAIYELDSFTNEAKRNGFDSFNAKESLEVKLSEQRTKVSSLQQQINEYLSDPILPLIWLGNIFEDYCEEWRKDKNSRQNLELIEEMKRRDFRIIKDLPEEFSQTLKNVLEKIMINDLGKLTSNINMKSYLLLSEDPSYISGYLEEQVKKIKGLLLHLKNEKKKLEKIELKLKILPQEDEFASTLAKLKELSLKQSEWETKIISLNKTISFGRIQLERLEKQIESHNEQTRKQHFSSESNVRAAESSAQSRKIFAAFKRRLLDTKIKNLSQKILFEFISLLRKKHFFSSIEIDPNSFSVRFWDLYGKEIPIERLSAGERQLFGIAVLRVLIQERECYLPIAVDTPLARLDSEYRRNLAEALLMKTSHQVIVLSTDEEVKGSIYEVLSPFISKEYVLRFLEETNTTNVEEVIGSKTILKELII